MKKVSLMTLFLLGTLLYSGDVVMMDEPYYQSDIRNTQLIYTQQNLPFAQYTASVEEALQPLYEEMFGYKMDEKLSVVLTSEYNQIPNGFSTQYPNNRQLNYIGGSLLADYFSATSWLDTLLYHETAHNYQANEKDNLISSSLHTLFANGAFFVPWFSVPNAFEGSFMAEGNAVLNESWHGKGGRLYNGEFKIEALMQAKAEKLTPQLLYNDNLHFLYGSHFYTLGGYYNYYLAKKYGLKTANAYWKYHSHYWFWPFFTNNPMEDTIGVDFEQSIQEWAQEMKKEADKVSLAQGEQLASSQFFSPMNSDNDAIYFIVNESGRNVPELVIYDKHSNTLTKEADSWLSGKVIRTKNKYTTQSSNFTNPWRIYIGLFDNDGEIIQGTQSKVVEGYLSDGKEVYFDVPSSYKEPQLYIGKDFYATVNSSVVIHNNDLYYFRQNDKTRTLYKNKTALMSMQGYYGHVVGVDTQGAVYFIANTEHGSGLFCYAHGQTLQVSPADTIIDARLIDDTHALVATVGSDAYNFKKITLAKEQKAPYEVILFTESKPYYRKADPKVHPHATPTLDCNNSFTPLLDMRYSATNLSFGVDDTAGFVYDVSLNFADPLTLNSFALFASRGVDKYTIGGLSYTNSQYFVDFMLTNYAILDRPNDASANERDYGLFASARIPFLRRGYWDGTLSASYYEDYQTNTRQPLSAVVTLDRYEHFGASLYPHFRLGGEGYYSHDRDSNSYGAKVQFAKALGHEVYTKMSAKYSQSDTVDSFNEKGVKITKSIFESLQTGDPTSIVMPSLKDTLYLKDATKATIDIKKVFNADAYFFTFPLSLRRESIFGGYTHYSLHGVANSYAGANEYKVGMLFDTYFMNLLPVPITLEYRYNDNTVIAERDNFRLFTGISF